MELESFRYQFHKFYPVLPKISLLGIRGYHTPAFPNPINDMYDDAIVRVIGDEIKIFQASVDPGSYYMLHPVNPQGCARLKCGLWQYKLGEHHNHPALVQADEVVVDRIDKEGKRLCEDHGYFGINIHSGGAEYLVGRYSAGCQIIKTPEVWKDKWQDFFLPIFAACGVFNQDKIPYLLIDRVEANPVDLPSVVGL